MHVLTPKAPIPFADALAMAREGRVSHATACALIGARAGDEFDRLLAAASQVREQRTGPVSGTGAFSTFAHFEASANARAGIGICLGDTFATGLAAQVVADKLPQVCKVAPQ